MVKKISKSIFVLLCSLLFSACGLSVNKDDETIQEAAREFNKSCPFQTDNLTTLDSVVYKSPKMIVFYSTTNVNLVKPNIRAIKANLKSNITNHILDSKSNSFKILKDIGASFHYIYKTQAGKEFLNVTFDPEFYSTQQTNHTDSLTDKEVSKLLEEIADLQNAQLPRQLDEYSILYKINAISPRTLEYIYRSESIINDIDTAYFSSSEAKQNILNDFGKTSNADRLLKDNKVTFRFTYEDKDGIHISSLDITPDEYK